MGFSAADLSRENDPFALLLFAKIVNPSVDNANRDGRGVGGVLKVSEGVFAVSVGDQRAIKGLDPIRKLLTSTAAAHQYSIFFFGDVDDTLTALTHRNAVARLRGCELAFSYGDVAVSSTSGAVDVWRGIEGRIHLST